VDNGDIRRVGSSAGAVTSHAWLRNCHHAPDSAWSTPSKKRIGDKGIVSAPPTRSMSTMPPPTNSRQLLSPTSMLASGSPGTVPGHRLERSQIQPSCGRSPIRPEQTATTPHAVAVAVAVAVPPEPSVTRGRTDESGPGLDPDRAHAAL